MEAYTRAHKNGANLDKAFREIHCLKVLFPRLFRTLEPGDQLPDVWIFFRLVLAVLLPSVE